ncbi:putative glycogen/starch/alpha-glucan phosphorylase [Magnetofaba australis IT-1]|uniref:Alpha-1,4 glucan phosphorylase n=1 Tax=Magnetofaba australis IT-1 TaxID=1434232 RepID=A0A1Y2K4J3_9PROT|nr:putative glycogen/starch/alpha-glucan phosphorylase [Magnetofaba australis IT-1]
MANLKSRLINTMIHAVGEDPDGADANDWYYAVAFLVRGMLSEQYIKLEREQSRQQVRRAYYLSMEFLIGRQLTANLLALDMVEPISACLEELGHSYEAVRNCEFDAALGNGGLGRLAACILDGLATHGYPGYGYCLRYEFGMFHQRIENGQQVEQPENWLRFGNPWELERHNAHYPIRFHGRLIKHAEGSANETVMWVETDDLVAMGSDMPMTGFRTPAMVNLRLWNARSGADFNLDYFNEGDFMAAVKDKTVSENLTKVLYPNDANERGQELRLKQEYFFVSASVQDIVSRYLSENGDIRNLPQKVVIHLNDTHPSLAIPELLRLLIDEYRLGKEEAWEVASQTFTYTNHTLLPEALETWSVDLLSRVLPRHLDLIYKINHRHLKAVMSNFPDDQGMLNRLSLIDDGSQRIRMGWLSVVGSTRVNGVAKLHSDLLKAGVFKPFHQMYPERFVNVTNGVTQRRWLLQSNPGLASLITSRIGPRWTTDLERLKELESAVDDAEFMAQFAAVKRDNKARLAERIGELLDMTLDPSALFDVQVKRIHEYKRQLLNLLSVIAHYNRIKEGRAVNPVPRVSIFAGKAAPGYYMAKLIIRLINDVAKTINADPQTRDLMRVAFIPNYNVSEAGFIFPGSDLSEQISTAGTEASGTGNMKFALNGALTIGTLDGANIEIREAVGAENFFKFGLETPEVEALRAKGYDPNVYINQNAELGHVMEQLRNGYFTGGDHDRYRDIVNTLTHGDHYLVMADFSSYMKSLEEVDALYRQPEEWSRRAMFNVARVGGFSIDRTVHTYAREIWGLKPLFRERRA